VSFGKCTSAHASACTSACTRRYIDLKCKHSIFWLSQGWASPRPFFSLKPSVKILVVVQPERVLNIQVVQGLPRLCVSVCVRVCVRVCECARDAKRPFLAHHVAKWSHKKAHFRVAWLVERRVFMPIDCACHKDVGVTKFAQSFRLIPPLTGDLFLFLLSFFRMSSLFDNISTRREVVEFRWDTQNTQTLPY